MRQGGRAGKGELRIDGIICPYLEAAKACGDRVCLICRCGEMHVNCARVEMEGLELFLDCNCRRDKALSLCHVRHGWDSITVHVPMRWGRR